MTKCPLISIIVPVYNCAKYLPQCIESILAQTYTNLQIILVDDGSTDNSGKICDDYALKDSRIKVIHQANKGVSAARNAGLKAAKGDYIGFVDADDYIAPGMFSYLYKLIKDYQVPVSVCNWYGLKGGECKVKPPVFTQEMVLTAPQALASLIAQLFMWNKLFHKTMLNGISFSTEVSYGEDMLVLLEVFQRAKQIVYGPVSQYYYRQHSSSATCRITWNPKHVSFITVTDKILHYAHEHQLWPLERRLTIIQMDMAIVFLRNCLINGPFDKESAEKLRRYLIIHIGEVVYLPLKIEKKCFAILACINFNLAAKVYRILKK